MLDHWFSHELTLLEVILCLILVIAASIVAICTCHRLTRVTQDKSVNVHLQRYNNSQNIATSDQTVPVIPIISTDQTVSCNTNTELANNCNITHLDDLSALAPNLVASNVRCSDVNLTDLHYSCPSYAEATGLQ